MPAPLCQEHVPACCLCLPQPVTAHRSAKALKAAAELGLISLCLLHMAPVIGVRDCEIASAACLWVTFLTDNPWVRLTLAGAGVSEATLIKIWCVHTCSMLTLDQALLVWGTLAAWLWCC